MDKSSNRTLAKATETRLRILQRRKAKHAVRLERIFWSQLDDLAREAKVSTSELVFGLFEDNSGTRNRASLLRCHCLDRARSQANQSRLLAQSFDLLGVIAACPTPVAVITPQRRISAFNPAFGELLETLRQGGDAGRAIHLSFSEPIQKIQQRLIDEPRRILVFQVGLRVGDGAPTYFLSRFALADRSQGLESLIVLFFEPPRPKAP